nr:reverse transcriptase domain-containing protein [Tanacetum cinerariifolium]
MVDSQPMEEEFQGEATRDVGMETHGGPIEPFLQMQKTPSPSPTFIKENIDVLRTMTKEHDQQAKMKATPRKLACADSDKEALDGSLRRDSLIDFLLNPLAHLILAGKLALPSKTRGLERARNRGGPREARRNMKVYTPYLRKDAFTPLTKTLKENLAMESISFPEPPPLIETPKKQNLNKFCDYHGDKAKWKPMMEWREAIPQSQLTDEPIILEGIIEGNQVRRILVDGGSSSEIMFEHCFRNVGINIPSRLRRYRITIIGFSGETYHPLRVIDLRVTLGKEGRSKTMLMEFEIIKRHSPYNTRIRRNKMKSLGAVGSTIHFMIKFPTNQGVGTMETSREAIQECKHLERVQGSWKEEYSQIRMAEDDEEKTGFHTEEGVYCFTHMLKELKKLCCYTSKDDGKEREGIHIPVSYVSRPLQGMEICYTPTEKRVQALIHTARSLRTVFRKHKVKAITDGSMKETLNLARREGQLGKWATEICTYDISYIQRKEAEGPVVKKLFGQGDHVEETPDANM